MNLFWFFICLLFVSCSSKHEVARGKLTIDFSQEENFDDRAVTDPGTAGDLTCVGVWVSTGTENEIGTCIDLNDVTVATPFTTFGPKKIVNAAAEFQFNLSVGPNRKFSIVGFKTNDGNCPTQFQIDQNQRTNISNIFILGENSVDLIGGDQEVNVNASIVGATKIKSCTGTGLSVVANTCDQNLTATNFNDIGGPGTTAAQPFIICNANQLETIGINAAAINKFYKIDQNIDYSGISAPHTIIGGNVAPFTGQIDGASNTISGFTHNQNTTDSHVGFIGRMTGGTVKNLKLTNVNIGGASHLGGLAGLADTSSTINNVFVTGAVAGNNNGNNTDNIGGVVGELNVSTLTKVTSSVNVTAASGKTIGNGRIGGVVGYCDGCTISKAKSSGTHTIGGNTNIMFDVGGIVGIVQDTSAAVNISECSFTGSISLDPSAAGFIGGVGGIISFIKADGTNGVTVTDIFSNATLLVGPSNNTGHDMGGLIGSTKTFAAGDSIVVNKGYSAGSVTHNSTGAAPNVGGVTGKCNQQAGTNSMLNIFTATNVVGGNGDNGEGTGFDTGGCTLSLFYADAAAGFSCTGGSGCDNPQATAVSVLSNFFSSSNPPLNAWGNFGTVWQQNTAAFPTLINVGSSIQ